MVRIQLSTGYLDVKEGTSFPLNFSVGDIRDISKRTGNFSKTITLVGNNNNNTLLNHYYDVNIQAGTFNINQLTSCDVIQDGIPVMTNATLQLINIKKSQLTSAYEQMVEYEVLIKEDRGTFFTDISNKYLSDLDFSDLDHVVDAPAVIASFNNTVTDGYKYVMPFNIDNQYQLNWFKPGIYAQTYFDRIFATSGYSYTWDGLEDANFHKLLIPYNGDQNIVDWNDYKVEVENSGQTLTATQTTSPYWSAPQVGATMNVTTGWTEISDPAGIYNATNGQYTTPQWTNNAAGQFYEYSARITGTVSLIPSSNSTANYINYYVKLGARISGAGNFSVRCTPIFFDGTSPISTTTNIGSFDNILTFQGAFNDVDQLGIDYADIQLLVLGVDAVAADVNGNDIPGPYDNFVPMWQIVSSPLAGPFTAPQIQVNVTTLELTIRPSDNIPLNSGDVFMNTFIPEKIKQSDFIKSIFMMYNLYATPDIENENNLILIARDEYYDSGKAVDWTNLLMKDKEQSIIFIPELSNKKLRLSYKADTDSPNTVYTDVTREIYGQVEVTFDNEYVKEIDVKELIFSPTPVQQTEFGAFLPLLNGAAPKTNIRILFDNGQVTAQEAFILSSYDNNLSTGGVYPYLSHFGGADPFNPTFDINFAPCQYYYYQVAQNTNNNLYNSYWRRTVAQINGGKLLTAYFYLRETDIQYMELNDKIRIDNSWWSINKIIDYNANDSTPTKVELISLETEIDLPPFFGGNNEPVGPGNGTQINSIMNAYRSTTNVTTNNTDALIFGSGNIVTDGVRGIVVGDYQALTSDGIATTNLTVTNTFNGRAVSDILPTYKKYIALISQSSTAAPTVIELENTIGPIVWTRISTGVYEGTFAGAFTLDKTYTTLSQVATNSIALVYRKTIDTIKIETTNLHSPTAAHHDTHLVKNTLEIRVYE
jgi:hypothetical protein